MLCIIYPIISIWSIVSKQCHDSLHSDFGALQIIYLLTYLDKKDKSPSRATMAHRAALISISIALSQLTLLDHGYGASLSRSVSVYLCNPSLMGYYSFNHPRRDGWQSWPCTYLLT